ncbi:hypothetical protein I6N90_24380 [Paenibacillus sp. GSMTC-2017]|uniref:alpha/beta hydrolase family protein n=1 Tax=Paenibacillus sp. GSMTC-2017 TaxID=2794350 RepID=UPI0018D9F215|nr:hypothetical protein [Paenibacillus sp. GSMTC-2017]MBH5320927.1 hypothetical protein [Paenibacillus sp. GSMTC-2017]
MRLIEIILVVCCLFLLAQLFSKKLMRKTGLFACIASGAALVLHLVIEGYRWQLGFIYGIVVLSITMVGAMHWRGEVRFRVWKPVTFFFYSLMILLTFASSTLALILPVFQLPEPDGHYKVGTTEFHFTDASREETFTDEKEDQRELMVQLWYPAQNTEAMKVMPVFPNEKDVFKTFVAAYTEKLNVPAFTLDYWKYIKSNAYQDAKIKTTEASYPVIILSHGMGTGKVIHASQAENLASHGYIVVAIDHTYNTMATAFPDGHVTKFNDKKADMDRTANSNWQLDIWADDVDFVLGQLNQLNAGLLPSAFTGKLDMTNVGIMGHSFGGATAFHSYYTNPDLKAGILMDSSMFELDTEYNITKPFMFIEAEDTYKMREKSKVFVSDEELKSINLTREQLNKAIEDNNKQYKIIDHAVKQGGTLIYVEGTSHYNFTDLQMYSPLFSLMGFTGEIEGSRGAYIVNQYVLDFFNKHLRGTGGELANGTNANYPEVIFPK